MRGTAEEYMLHLDMIKEKVGSQTQFNYDSLIMMMCIQEIVIFKTIHQGKQISKKVWYSRGSLFLC